MVLAAAEAADFGAVGTITCMLGVAIPEAVETSCEKGFQFRSSVDPADLYASLLRYVQRVDGL